MGDWRRTATARASRLRGVGVVVVAAVLGTLVPAPDAATRLVTPIVVVLVYGSLRDLRPDDLGDGLLVGTLGALLVAHVAVPATALFAGERLLPPDALLGFVVFASGPTTAGSALVWTRIGGGRTALTAAVAATSLLLAPLVTPVTLAVLLGERVAVPVVPVLRELLLVVAGGVVLLWALPNERFDERQLDRSFLAAIGVLVYVSVATSDLAGMPVALVATVALAAVFPTGVSLLLSLVTRSTLGFGPAETRALFFGTALKNLGVALVVAASLGAVGDAVVAIAVCYVFQQVVAGLVAGSL